MSEKTGIGWTDHTGGPWLGCSMVSAGCTNCYAMELMQTRLFPIIRKAYKAAGFEDWETRPIWGDKATRVLSKGFWNDARRINAAHAKAGTRGKWFPSMIDWLDTCPAGMIGQEGNHLNPADILARFLQLIVDTTNLDWLLLTKRPEKWAERMLLANRDEYWVASEWLGGRPPANVKIGVSVENQEQADLRIPQLLQIPAHVRFLSVEPLLERVNLGKWVHDDVISHVTPVIDWVIVGLESGKDRRDCGVEALVDVAKQCVAAGVPCFVKQDCALNPGQRGRIPADIWALKQFPK